MRLGAKVSKKLKTQKKFLRFFVKIFCCLVGMVFGGWWDSAG